MRKWNKLLALVLAMVMVFGLTATAFAANNDEGEQTPAAGTQTPADEDKNEPAEGEDAEDPAEGEDAQEPAEGEGEDAEDPAEGEGEDAEDPAEGEGEDAKDPAEGEGEDAEDPAEGEGEDAEDPAEGEDAKDPVTVTFSDVAENNWFYEFVMKMAAAEVVNGYTDGTFRPQGQVTWGQALKMALLTAKYEDAKPVEGGSWASGYIALAKAEGIIAADAEIDHNANITRVEMCELLAKALKIAASEKESIFSDTDNGYVMALVDLGVISVADTFNPNGELTRAELCKILASVPETTEPAEPTEPAEDEDAQEPTEGEDAQDPAEGEDAQDPAEGEEDKKDDTAEPETDAEGETEGETEGDATPDEDKDAE